VQTPETAPHESIVRPLFSNAVGPRAHDGASDAELAIFSATERLLDSTALQKISVAMIIKEADVSRGTFYHYFGSKHGPVAGLVARVMNEIHDQVQPYLSRSAAEAPEVALRRSLQSAIDVWGKHRHVIRAATEHWPEIPELRTLWLGSVERFTDGIAAEIDRERTLGIAPPGPDSRSLAAALLWGTEHCLYVAGLRADDDLPDETATLEPVLAMWLGTVYGGTVPQE
jgi:TetR/AcrR family transcriptional regulator, ethionamide resistance regulator